MIFRVLGGAYAVAAVLMFLLNMAVGYNWAFSTLAGLLWPGAPFLIYCTWP